MSDGRRIDRRTLLKGAAAGGLAAAGALAVSQGSLSSAPGTRRRHGDQPNILVVLVDQMRYPRWFSAVPGGVGLPPNVRRIRDGGVLFAGHYTASNDCSPARATLLTGLYSTQTWTLITGGSTLDPGFPTWGTMLREQGYQTRWFGKWHLTHGDKHWNERSGERALERYGFAGGVYPSPDGEPGQGHRRDGEITARFREWLREEGRGGPWCATLSYVNPHDIAWWYAWSGRVRAEAHPPSTVHELPANFETPEQLIERGKPALQRSLQQTAANSFGAVPFDGPGAKGGWLGMLDLYAQLQRDVDVQVGRALDALLAEPEVARNTVIIFTSDHGEYAASHGLRGKGAGVYEEAINVPLIVNDLRGRSTRSPSRVRRQLTSSVDIAPLLLTLASGDSQWRRDIHYRHIADRADIAAMLLDPAAPGRPHVLHTTDEIVTEFATEPYDLAPLHVTMIRTHDAKYATYRNWSAGGTTPLSAGAEEELYDYRSSGGRLEMENVAGSSPALAEDLAGRLEGAMQRELHAPLPGHLAAAQHRGRENYLYVAKSDALQASRARLKLTHSRLGDPASLTPPDRT